MAELVTSAFGQVFYLPSNLTFTAKDPHDAISGRTITMASGYYYLWAANGSGSGTEGDPWNWRKQLQTALNAGSGGGNYWTVALTATGLFTVTSSATAELAWSTGGGAQVANVVGFAQSTFSFSAAQTRTGTSKPLYALYTIGRPDDTGWMERPQSMSLVSMPTGSVYGWHDGTRTFTRKFISRFHPSTETIATALTAYASPFYPNLSARYMSPTATLSTSLTPPWSVTDFFGTAIAVSIACVFGTWQTFYSSAGLFDVAYLTPEALMANDASNWTQRNWSQRRDRTSITLSLYAKDVTAT